MSKKRLDELAVIRDRVASELSDRFSVEYDRLLASHAFDVERDSASDLIRAALENVAFQWAHGNSPAYRNLRKI